MITINELFSGIGSQKKAFTMLEIPHQVNCTAEIDKDAMLSYAAIHYDFDAEFKKFIFPDETEMKREMVNKRIGYDYKEQKHTLTRVKGLKLKKYYLAYKLSKNMGDISKIKQLPYADFWSYSFPCQDLSVAGKQAGISKGTRSGLLLEVERLLTVSHVNNELPKYLMLENVKNLIGKKHKADFFKWLSSLEQLGYKNYWQVLNAKDYGIPQNRERVFVISIRNDITQSYYFPQKFDSGLRLRDMLEAEVDEKYYLFETLLNGFILHNQNHTAKGTGFLWQPRDLNGHASCLRANSALNATDNTIQPLGNLHGENGHNGFLVYKTGGIAPALKARDYKDPIKVSDNRCEVLGNLCGGKWDKIHDIAKRVHSPLGISPTIHTMGGGNLEPKVKCLNPKDKSGNQPQQQDRVYDTNGLMIALLAEQSGRFNIAETSIKYLKETDNSISVRRKTDYGDFGIQGQQANFPDSFLDTVSTSHYGNVVELPAIVSSRGRNPDNPSDRTTGANLEQRLEVNTQGISNTLTSVQKDNYVLEEYFRIRKLTPKECWRLMGFTDSDIEKAQAQGVSDSQLYKQAGNSIVTNVLYYLYKNLFVTKNIPQDCDMQIQFF